MTYQVTLRDRIAYKLCDFAVRIATPEYQALIRLSFQNVLDDAIATRRNVERTRHEKSEEAND